MYKKDYEKTVINDWTVIMIASYFASDPESESESESEPTRSPESESESESESEIATTTPHPCLQCVQFTKP